MAAVKFTHPNTAMQTYSPNKKRSKVLPVILLVIFIAALLCFSISLCKVLPHTTNDYYQILIKKFEVGSPHDTAVIKADDLISSLRTKAVIFGAISSLSLIGSVFCISALRKSE